MLFCTINYQTQTIFFFLTQSPSDRGFLTLTILENNIFVDTYTEKIRSLLLQFNDSENKEGARKEIDHVIDHFVKFGSKFPLEHEVYITHDGGLFQELFGKTGIKVSKQVQKQG